MVTAASSLGGWKRADVVVATASAGDYRAVLEVDAGAGAGGGWREADHRGLPVALRELAGRGGRALLVVVARAPERGKGPTLTVMEPLVELLRPSCVAMCGTCAGDPGKTRLGDVVAGERIYDHDVGKLTADGLATDLRPYSVPVPWRIALERFAAAARFANEGWWLARPVPYAWQEAWLLVQLHAGIADPRELPDVGVRCPQWADVVDRLWLRGELEVASLTLTEAGRQRAAQVAVRYRVFPDLSPTGEQAPFRLHVAPIGSGSAEIEDEGAWARMRAHMRSVIAIETEASALADLVRSRPRHHPLDAVVMKGVAGHADGPFDERFEHFAARASAECLFAFLRDQLPNASGSDVAMADDERDDEPLAASALDAEVEILVTVRVRRNVFVELPRHLPDVLAGALPFTRDVVTVIREAEQLVVQAGARLDPAVAGRTLSLGDVPLDGGAGWAWRSIVPDAAAISPHALLAILLRARARVTAPALDAAIAIVRDARP